MCEPSTNIGTNRPLVTPEQIFDAAACQTDHLYNRLKKKGYGSFASSHELLGILLEEFCEVEDAVHGDGDLRAELQDLATACIFGVACIDADTLDW